MCIVSSPPNVRMQEDGYDPYRLPYWIRATFIMEERWGELEAEFHATQDAVQLAEEWGVVSPVPHYARLPCIVTDVNSRAILSETRGPRIERFQQPNRKGLALRTPAAGRSCNLRSRNPEPFVSFRMGQHGRI